MRPEKRHIVEELGQRIQTSKLLVLADYSKMKSQQMDELRRILGERGGNLRVVKNSMMRRAVLEVDREGLVEYLEGPTAMVEGGEEDFLPVLKSLVEFSRANRVPRLRGGMIGDQFVGLGEIETLAFLPPKEVLRAMLLAGVRSPLSGFVGVLQGVLRSLVSVLKQISEKNMRIEGGKE